MKFQGYKEIEVTDEQLACMYNGTEETDIAENEFILAMQDGFPIDIFVCKNGILTRSSYSNIYNYEQKLIKAKDFYQQMAIDSLCNQCPIKVITGRQGTGKTLLGFNACVRLLKKKLVDRIVMLRPHFEVQGMPLLGTLPGDVDEKIGWTEMSLFDKIDRRDLEELRAEGKFLSLPINFIRGISFNRTAVLCSEAQNMDVAMMQLLISRIGEGSYLIVEGDLNQVDKERFKHDSGLEKLCTNFRGQKEFCHVDLYNVYRSRAAELAVLMEL